MKKVLFALVVAVMSASVLAEAKTWPAGYNIATLTDEQVPDPAEPATFGSYEAERVETAESLTTLDTFLFAIFDAEGELSGFSTIAPGFLLLFK